MNVKRFFHQYAVEIFLFLATLFIRFPFFFRDYIDKDESTFILMGQSIADGHLPYDHLWDLKPPLLFYFFALVEKVFPHSFVAIRFMGVVVVFLSAILLLKIARQSNLKNGFLIALGYVVLSSEFGSLQGVMSEHFAVFFLLLGILIFLRQTTNINFFLAGLAFGCAVLCKLNYAYAIAAIVLFYFFDAYRKRKIRQGLMQLLILTAGILVPVILIALPFLFAGKINLFFNSVFLAPLEYARAMNLGLTDKLKTTWWVIVLTVGIIYLARKFSKEDSKPIVRVSAAVLLGTVYTFFSSGIINGHYLVQIYPFILLLVFGVIIQNSIRLKLSVAALFVILVSFESILEYGRVIKMTKNPAEYRATFEVIDELKKRQLDDTRIFFADYHIGYWILGQYPLTRSTTHPSNLARPYLFPFYNESRQTSLQELKFILEDIKPGVIVSEVDGLKYFPGGSAENIYFGEIIKKDFRMIYKDPVDRIYIWERVIK